MLLFTLQIYKKIQNKQINYLIINTLIIQIGYKNCIQNG